MKSGNQILPVKMGLKTEKGNFFFNNLEQETGKIKHQIRCRHASGGKERKCQKDDLNHVHCCIINTTLHYLTSSTLTPDFYYVFVSSCASLWLKSTLLLSGGSRECWFENMMTLCLFIICPYGTKR